MQNAIRKTSNEDVTKLKYIKENLPDILAYINKLHGRANNGEYVKLLNRDKSNTYQMIKVEDLRNPGKLINILMRTSLDDLMISANTFKTADSSKSSNLARISNICIDVDYRRNASLKELKPEQVMGILESEAYNKTIPYPSIIEYGYQIRLIYVLDKAVISPNKASKMVSAIKCIGRRYASNLEAFHAEYTNPTLFTRLPWSINSKDGSSVKYDCFEEFVGDVAGVFRQNYDKYSMDDLFEWMPDLPEWYDDWKAKQSSKPKTKKKVVAIRDSQSLLERRLTDLRTVQSYHNENDEYSGFRQVLCYVYRNTVWAMTDDYERAKAEVVRFNNEFSVPKQEHQMLSKTKTPRPFKFKDSTIRDLIGNELCESLGVFMGTDNKVKCDNYYQKKKAEKQLNGETKAQQIEAAKQAIVTLRNNKMKNKDIMIKLDIKKPTYDRYVRQLKEEGRL